jgi:hypothetical protein
MNGKTEIESLERLAARLLEQALLITIVAHAAAMLSMALLLLTGIPGGSNPDPLARATYIAQAPWLWRLGWLPWQLTALSDVILAVALIRTAWIPRLPALFVLIATLIAVFIEQPGEFRWITEGVALAQAAVQTGDPAGYVRFETAIYPQVAAWAAAFYTVAALGWTCCFAAAGVWNRFMTGLSVVTWLLLLAVSIGPLLPVDLRPDLELIGAGNAVGFVLLLLWLSIAAELVLRRARPDGKHGRQVPWIYPRRSWFGRLVELVTNSRLVRAFGEWLPLFALVSDITDVIYVNYMVEAARLEPFVPPGLALQRLGPGGAYAMFTHLTYRHGHFGPDLLGPARRWLPSPIQSNWRIYVDDPQTGRTGIYFVTTAINSLPHALLGRFFSEGLPMHLPACGEVVVQADGAIQVTLDPGSGSAPDLRAQLRPVADMLLTGQWAACFDSYRSMLAYCVPQDRALSVQPWYGRITRQEIQLGIPLEACEPLSGEVNSSAAQQIVGDARPLCFRVGRVAFRFEAEIADYYSRRLV